MSGFAVGDRVGVAWPRRTDGGYAEYTTVPAAVAAAMVVWHGCRDDGVTIPYWALRRQADHLVTGIGDTFLTAYRDGSFEYLLIAAGRV